MPGRHASFLQGGFLVRHSAPRAQRDEARNRGGGALSHWLAPAFGEGLTLAIDTDRIEALSPDRAALWQRVTQAPFLTINEKRLATGYGPVEGGDVFMPQ